MPFYKHTWREMRLSEHDFREKISGNQRNKTHRKKLQWKSAKKWSSLRCARVVGADKSLNLLRGTRDVLPLIKRDGSLKTTNQSQELSHTRHARLAS